MNILIAEDEAVSALMLAASLKRWGHVAVITATGTDALAILEGADAPKLALLDWTMPGLTGPEVCQRLRTRKAVESPYLILLTAKGRDDAAEGLASGADDFVTKPFNPAELQARIAVGVRMLQLQATLNDRVHELEHMLAQVKRLQGLVPICAWCKNVRNDQNYWQQVETYIAEKSEARFTHGVCPACTSRLLKAKGFAAPNELLNPAPAASRETPEFQSPRGHQ